MWNPNRTRQFTVAGRRNRFKRMNKLEISDAIGGRKSVNNTGKIIEQTVNMYTHIAVTNDQYSFPLGSKELNIQALLNDSQEFLDLRRKALEYKIVQVAVNFNYNYIPLQGNRFPKMILTPETDTVLQVQDPLKNRNSMVWDMTRIGNKNFNFRISKQNTEESNLEWQNGAAQWSGICILHLSQVSTVESDPNVNLGDVKISVQVLYRPVDSGVIVNRITDKEVIQYMKNKMKEEKQLEQIQEEIQRTKSETKNYKNKI
jgi:hypothetical protein